MRRYFSWLFLLLSLILVQTACAQQAAHPNPTPLLQSLSDQMIAALKKNKASMQENPEVVAGIVKKILVPHADLVTMARSALGRNAWMNATKSQQDKFIAAFTNLMINTYGAGLSSYTDEKVEFMPLRDDWANQNRIEVHSKIIRSDGPPIAVDYRLIYKADAKNADPINNWQMYDFSVEGVSMIQSFRSQFAADLSRGDSIDVLTQKIIAHNSGANNASN